MTDEQIAIERLRDCVAKCAVYLSRIQEDDEPSDKDFLAAHNACTEIISACVSPGGIQKIRCRTCKFWEQNQNSNAGPSTSGPACIGSCSLRDKATNASYGCQYASPNDKSSATRPAETHK